jgi:hypothetical protein
MKEGKLNLLHRYLDGAIAPDELESLEELPCSDAEARATLLSLATIDATWQQLGAEQAFSQAHTPMTSITRIAGQGFEATFGSEEHPSVARRVTSNSVLDPPPGGTGSIDAGRVARPWLTLNTDLTDPHKRANIDGNSIEELIVSKTSPMPADLFNRITKDEILDLTAYLISGGDSKHEYFRK